MKDLYKELQEASGTQFQKVFTKLMKKKYKSNYQGTQTYGNKGDRSVDGVLNNTIAFAIYAPEIYTDSNAIDKIKSDYEGFQNERQEGHW